MMIMARDRDYGQLTADLKGKNVAIWTCNTCARLCYGLGGISSAERLAEKLEEDGIQVTGTAATSASCIESKLSGIRIREDTDVLLSLTCSLGADCASRVFGLDVLNPVRTFGHGILSGDDSPVLITKDSDGNVRRTPLLALCGGTPSSMPFA